MSLLERITVILYSIHEMTFDYLRHFKLDLFA